MPSPTDALGMLADAHVAGSRASERRTDLDFRTVELAEPVGPWPRGTEVVIVDAFTHEALVEIVDESGHTRDLLTVDYSWLVIRPT
jgi:hypothetical protein